MARGWSPNVASRPAPTPSGAPPLKAVSLLRKTSKTSKAPASAPPSLLPKRGDTSLFAEVDRAAGGRRNRSDFSSGQTAKMTAASKAPKAEQAADPGMVCVSNDDSDNSQGDACARNDDYDDMCASSSPPLTTITIDVDDEDGCESTDMDEEQPMTNHCPSTTDGNHESDESLHTQDTSIADDRPQSSSEGGGVIYDKQQDDIAENGGPPTPGRPRPILRRSSAPPDLDLNLPPSNSSSSRKFKPGRRISWNESVGYALIPTLSEVPGRIRRDMYYTASEEGAYRSATKEEIRALRRHPVVVQVNLAASREHGNDLFAPRDYHRHSSLSNNGNENDTSTQYHCTRGVEHHLLPRDLRRERSARIKSVVDAVIYDQYYQHERGMYDEDRLAKVSQKRTRPFRRRARELAKADEAEMVAWLGQDQDQDMPTPRSRACSEGGKPQEDPPMDQSSKSLRIEEVVSTSTTFKDKFDNDFFNFNNEVALVDDDEENGHPNDRHHNHHQDQQGMHLDCDDFADVNLDSYTSLDQRLEQQYHREMSERLMARICR